jgi:CheY-like chemotaxis protein
MATTAFRFLFPPIGVQFLASSIPDHPADSNLPDEAQEAASPHPPRVLVVDDETLIADSVTEILNRNGYEARAVYSGADAICQCEVQRPDIVVTDVIMPDMDGIRLAIAVRAICPNTRIVLFSGNAATPSLLDNAGIDGVFFELLTKPVHPAKLLKTLKS